MKEDGSLKQYARQLIFVALSENRKERKAIHPIPCIFIIAKMKSNMGMLPKKKSILSLLLKSLWYYSILPVLLNYHGRKRNVILKLSTVTQGTETLDGKEFCPLLVVPTAPAQHFLQEFGKSGTTHDIFDQTNSIFFLSICIYVHHNSLLSSQVW